MSQKKRDKPLLIGLLIDVSSSMVEQLKNRAGNTFSHLNSIQDSLDDLVAHVRSFYDDAENTSRPFDFFAFGFGFGNIRDTLLKVLVNQELATVRSLLTDDEVSPIVSGDQLLQRWKEYRSAIRNLYPSMGGATPLVEALRRTEDVFTAAIESGMYGSPSVLLIVSDGLPTDPTEAPDTGPDLVRESCKRLRNYDVSIVSCFVTTTDLTQHKKLYRAPVEAWTGGARLMFDCASELTNNSVFLPHLREYKWETEENAKLFAQINQSEFLSEFVRLAVAPLEQPEIENSRAIRVFVSYCHHDARYVTEERGSLLSYLRGLEDDGVEFWLDRRLTAGDLWDGEIKQQLGQADIALVLVSQEFLNSKYCKTVEIPSFIKSRIEKGLRIVPVTLSACDWRQHDWLAATQAIPGDGKNIESHYSSPAKRKEVFLHILQQLRQNARIVRKQR